VGNVTTDVTIRRAELVVPRRARILPRLAPLGAIERGSTRDISEPSSLTRDRNRIDVPNPVRRNNTGRS
jgi:hypothetical protein